MRVSVKIKEDKSFEATLRYKRKLWVYLKDGHYFYIHEGHSGVWYQMYALYMDYPSMDAAIVAALTNQYAEWDREAQYRRCRCKPRTYTFHPPKLRKRKRKVN